MEGKDKNTDTDSYEARNSAHDKFLRFLNHTKLSTDSQKERIEWLKKMDFEEFMNILSIANSILTNRDRFRYWSGHAIRNCVDSTMGYNAALDPPDHAEVEFKLFYNNMKEKLNEKNIDIFALKLYLAIVFSHMFKDGNGRTARHAYALMNHGKTHDDDLTKFSNPNISTICIEAGLQGMLLCFQNEGINIQNTAELKNYYLTNHGFKDGDMSYLRYLAARRILKANNPSFSAKVIEETQFTKQQKKAFESAYSSLRRDWFWAIQEAVENNQKFQDLLKETLDQITLNQKT